MIFEQLRRDAISMISKGTEGDMLVAEYLFLQLFSQMFVIINIVQIERQVCW